MDLRLVRRPSWVANRKAREQRAPGEGRISTGSFGELGSDVVGLIALRADLQPGFQSPWVTVGPRIDNSSTGRGRRRPVEFDNPGNVGHTPRSRRRRVKLETQAKRVGDLEDRRPGRIAFSGECLVKPVAAHANSACQFAHVL